MLGSKSVGFWIKRIQRILKDSKCVGEDYVKYQSEYVVKKDITALTLLSLRELRAIYNIELESKFYVR